MTELSDCEASKFNQIKFNRMLCLKISLSDVIVIDETAPPELKSENMYRMNEHKIKGIEIYSLIRINFFFFFFGNIPRHQIIAKENLKSIKFNPT